MILTLRSRVFVILLAMVFILGATAFYVHTRVMLPNFLELEQQHIRVSLQRVIKTLDNELEHLARLNFDWAASDDTYRFIVDHNRNYIESNLVDATFSGNPLNLVYLVDADNRTLWGRAFGPGFASKVALPEFDRKLFPDDYPLFRHRASSVPLAEQVTTGL